MSRIFVSMALLSVSIAVQAKSEYIVKPDAPLTEVKIFEGDSFLSYIEGSVLEVTSKQVSLCPERRRPHDLEPGCFMLPETSIKVLFRLGGCMDRLGPVSINVVRNERLEETALVVSALRIANKKSLVAFCAAMPTQKLGS
ncbi:MAG: hypothetical protein NT027_10150 [Proteobacteria bacterium]|nr:hypothetical protein [Pseudomonadota bacterium]